MTASAPSSDYFTNHHRHRQFPWSLYHDGLRRQIARAIESQPGVPKVLVVGCGLEPELEPREPRALYFACDVDERAVEQCRRMNPAMSDRLAVCPSTHQLPNEGEFATDFQLVVAKEVVEHLDRPEPWAQLLASRVAVGGELVLTTPNYGRWSTLPLLERTVLEWIAARDGFSRKHIHPTRFDVRRLASLDVGPGMKLHSVERAWTGWSLIGRWTRVSPRAAF